MNASWIDYVVILALIGLASVGVVVLTAKVVGWLLRLAKVRVQLLASPTFALPVPPQPEPAAAPGPTWQAMVCGRRLELGATGFYVTFDPAAPLRVQYQLFTPEGELVSFGPVLQGLKAMGEQLARDRGEFAPAPVPKAAWDGKEVGHG